MLFWRSSTTHSHTVGMFAAGQLKMLKWFEW